MSGGPDCSDHPDPESDKNAISSDEVKKTFILIYGTRIQEVYATKLFMQLQWSFFQ